MNALARSGLFLGSYSPLAVLLAIRLWDKSLPLSIGLVTASVVLVLYGLWLFGRLRSTAATRVRVESRDPKSEAIGGYLVGWLFPLLVLEPGDTLSVTVVVVFFLLLGVVYVRGNLIHLNPFLSLLGYNVWEVTAMAGGRRIQFTLVCAAPDIQPDDELLVSGLDAVIRYGRLA
jgi:hypothetical protein